MKRLAFLLVVALVAAHGAHAQSTEVRNDLVVRRITIAREAPVTAAQFEVHTQAVSTTPVHVFSADLTVTTQRIAGFLQEVRISNRHASNGLCWKPVTFATSCAATCAASSITCSGAATDGDFIAPGSWISLPITGLECACAIASAAATTTTAARVKRSLP